MSTTRARIVDAADRLFYEQGFENTSFADIAETVNISRGNFYYHFKSKDEILAAVIEARRDERREMLARWEAEAASPQDRIRCFIDILARNRGDIERYGCPIGTLSAELIKLEHASAPDANGLFTVFRDWLREQFALLGHGDDADALAMHVLARSQGVATLMHAFGEAQFVEDELAQLHEWLATRTPQPTAQPTRPSQEA
ncbi:MAG: helix-turn-helix domain-containing protein [Actinomycetota bacterium]|nr:helix-turn-helix domain-containing protein [Actinomycetota bacterium]